MLNKEYINAVRTQLQADGEQGKSGLEILEKIERFDAGRLCGAKKPLGTGEFNTLGNLLRMALLGLGTHSMQDDINTMKSPPENADMTNVTVFLKNVRAIHRSGQLPEKLSARTNTYELLLRQLKGELDQVNAKYNLEHAQRSLG